MLSRAWELGCTFWDSSDAYGDNEDLLGKWFAQHPSRRADIVLATKFGILYNPTTQSISIDSSPARCRQQCERSLQRLGVPCIDLYYVHRVDGRTPIEHTMRELVALHREGKIKHIGLSECSAATLRRAHAVHPIAAVQVEYNPWDLDIETEAAGTNLLATCRELGVATVAYSPLGRGMLTGQFRSPADFAEDDFRRVMERWNGENFGKNLELVDAFVAIAAEKEKKKGSPVTPGQLALAWVLKQGEDVVPIPGTKRIKYLEENLGALKVELTDEEEKLIREKVDAAAVVGKRSPDGFNSFGDTPEE